MEWVKCSEMMPEIGNTDWRTPLPVIINCDIGVIPAYYVHIVRGDDLIYGFMESLAFGDGRGDRPDEDENRLIITVTEWMPMPPPPPTE